MTFLVKPFNYENHFGPCESACPSNNEDPCPRDYCDCNGADTCPAKTW